MVLNSYKPGTLCWAKLKGYPWWPSRIEKESELSDEVIESKPRSGRVYPVLFFGSLDYAWLTPENLEPYEENLAKFGSKAKNRKDPSFADALEQAQDPSIADEIIRRSAISASNSGEEMSDDTEEENEESEEQDEEDQGEGEQDEEEMGQDDADKEKVEAHTAEGTMEFEEERKATDKNENKDDDIHSAHSSESDAKYAIHKDKKKSTQKRTRQDETTHIVRSKEYPLSQKTTASDEEWISTKRPRADTMNKSSDERCSSVDNDEDGADASRGSAKDSSQSRASSVQHTPEHRSKGTHRNTKDDGKHDKNNKGHQRSRERGKPYHFLMQLRHKLQKTVIKGPVPEDLSPVNEVFKRLEDFDMTLELIQDTKLGKVMRIIAASDRLDGAQAAEYDIRGRAQRLAEKWKRLIVKRREGSVEPIAPDSPYHKLPDRKNLAKTSKLDVDETKPVSGDKSSYDNINKGASDAHINVSPTLNAEDPLSTCSGPKEEMQETGSTAEIKANIH